MRRKNTKLIIFAQTKNMLELITLEYSFAEASFITQIEQRCRPKDDETMQQQRTATTGNQLISCNASVVFSILPLLQKSVESQFIDQKIGRRIAKNMQPQRPSIPTTSIGSR